VSSVLSVLSENSQVCVFAVLQRGAEMAFCQPSPDSVTHQRAY